jgi:hypothetical protein
MGFPDGRWRVAVAALVASVGCATTQTVDLHCVPDEVTVYVDGRELDETPDSIELDRDEAHKIYFKGGPYEPQMVVLESIEREGESRLEPAELCTETTVVKMRPEVEVRVDPADEPLPAGGR